MPGRSISSRSGDRFEDRVADLDRSLDLSVRTEVTVGRRIWGRERFIDVIYLDPPYHPVSKTTSLTAHDRGGSNELDQASLRDVFVELARQGVRVVLSNSDTPLVRRLYRGFRVERVLAKRAINSRADRRGRVAEVIARE